MVGTLQGSHEGLVLCSKDMPQRRLQALADMLLHNLTHAIRILLLGSNGAFQGHRTVQHVFPDSVRLHMRCTRYNFSRVDKSHPYSHPRDRDHSGSQYMVLNCIARTRLNNQQDSHRSGVNKDYQR